MRKLMFSVLSLVCASTMMFAQTSRRAMVEASPIQPQKDTTVSSTNYINELGLTFTVQNGPLKTYVTGLGVAPSPLTSGFGSGFQVGRHYFVSQQATIGMILGANAYYSNTPANFFGTSSPEVTAQLYQVASYFTGRVYFGESWQRGIFAELGAGPEVSAVSFNSSGFLYQANLGTRLGVGYNYKFSNDVTLGLSVLASPSVTNNNYLDGSKLLINLLW